MTLAIHNAALISIDVQQGFDDPAWGRRNNPQAEEHIAQLLAMWRRLHWPLFHVQHQAGTVAAPRISGTTFKEIAQPLAGETIITKQVNSAFIGTDLETMLRAQQISTVVIMGLTTNHCVETTTRMAGNLGFTTFLVGDATATFDRVGPDGILYPAETIHAISLASIHNEFAQVVTTGMVLAAGEIGVGA